MVAAQKLSDNCRTIGSLLQGSVNRLQLRFDPVESKLSIAPAQWRLRSNQLVTMLKHFELPRLILAGLAAITVVAGMPAATHVVNAETARVEPKALASKALGMNGAFDTKQATPDLASTVALTRSVYVPVLMRDWPAQTLFGVEIGSIGANAAALASVHATWARKSGLNWNEVEATQGGRDWSKVAPLETEMIAASKNNIRLIVVVFGTPAWAQKVPGSTCGPMLPDKIAAFAKFMSDAVARYSQPPYNVKYWEIWNEEDVRPPGLAGVNFGCWGDATDPHFGGGYYASMLKQVAPQIRTQDPAAKILLGGLLLDCPTPAPQQCDDSPNPGTFLEGILAGGGGDSFDGVSFHAYDFYDVTADVVGKYTWPKFNSTGFTTGPSLITKAQFIKSVLAKYNVTGKFLINTEVAHLCYFCTSGSPNFELSKAYYVAQSSGAAIAQGLVGNLWYSWEGWNVSGVYGSTLTAFQTAGKMLSSVVYTSDIGTTDVGTTGVRGYKFSRNSHALWLIWSADGNTKSVTLSSTPKTITDALGVTQSVTTSLQLTVKPLYIEFP